MVAVKKTHMRLDWSTSKVSLCKRLTKSGKNWNRVTCAACLKKRRKKGKK